MNDLRQRYMDLKAQYPDHVVLLRMGDFYEALDDDARVLEAECDVIVTVRPLSNSRTRIQMAGIPHQDIMTYVERLHARGYAVALVESEGTS